jgi:hypothetical protein
VGALALAMASVVASAGLLSQAEAHANLAVNGGFEEIGPNAQSPAVGWSGFWSRDEGAGSAVLDETVRHGGERSLKVVHTGTQDWSVSQVGRVEVQPGDILRLTGWVKCEGVAEDVTLSVIPYGANGDVLTWFWGSAHTKGTHDFELLESRFAVPSGCRQICLRLTGVGPGTAWVDDVDLAREGNVADMLARLPAQRLTIESKALAVVVDALAGTVSIRDRRVEASWLPPRDASPFIVRSARVVRP